MPELIGEFTSFHLRLKKEFCWIAFDWQYSMSAAITYLNGPLNLNIFGKMLRETVNVT